MLLTLEQITAATKLDARGVEAAVQAAGYLDVCRAAKFLGMTPNGSFLYEIEFKDLHSGDIDTCKVYIGYRTNPVTELPQLIASF